MEMMIRKRGGLAVVAFVMACIVAVQANNNVPSDSIVASLRGGVGGGRRRSLIHTATNTDKDSYYYKPIISSSTRKLEDQDEDGDNEQQQDNDDQGNEEEEQDDQEEQQDDLYQNDDGDMNNNNDDASNSNGINTEYIDNLIADLRDRFDSDVVTMWNTSPGEWDEEIWKDFGIVAGIIVGLLAFLCLCCCCCCRGGGGNNGKELNAITQEEADARRKKKRGHRGRFFHRNRSEDTDCSRSEHTDYTSPFVLIEDVEKDDTFKTHGSKSTAGVGGTATSPVYGRGGASADIDGDAYATLSPLSSNSKTTMQSPGARLAVPSLNEDDDGANGKTLKKNSSVLQEPSGGIVGETVDVWSEFLGFKKTKYNMKTTEVDEDSAIDETDDERERRGGVRIGRSSARSRRKSSSKKDIVVVSNSDETNTSKKLMGSVGSVHTDTVADVVDVAAAVSTTGTTGAGSISGEAADTTANIEGTSAPSSTTSTNSSINKMTTETPIMSNAKSSTKSPRHSSRKNFLKTKNLLRSFGSGNKIKTNNNKEQDSKEESLLGGEDGEYGEDI
jgi:hypothetical protein